jgi:hypothetical protein
MVYRIRGGREDLFYCFSPAAKRRPGNPSARSEPKEKGEGATFFLLLLLYLVSIQRQTPSLWMERSRRSNKESTWASLFFFFFLSISRLLLTDVFPNCLLLTLRILSRSVGSHLRSGPNSLGGQQLFGFYFILNYRFAIGEIPPPRSRKRKTR